MVEFDFAQNWAEVLGAGHPALRPDGKLKDAAVKILLRPPMPSRVATYPEEYGFVDPIRNTELFLAIADFIEMFPESYNQEVWGDDIEGENAPPCGTAFCIAGHAGHETGWLPRTIDRPSGKVEHDYCVVRNLKAPQHGFKSVESIGRLELGLTAQEADVLFNELWRPVDTVAGALRDLAWGARVSDVTYGWSEWDDDDPHPLDTEYANRGEIQITGRKELR